MTKDMKKIIAYAVSGAVIDVAAGFVTLDIFNKAISNLPLKRSTFRSIGMTALKFSVFNTGIGFASKEVDPILKNIFGINKMNPEKVAQEFCEDLRNKLNRDETVTEDGADDISAEVSEEEEEE